jgi:hypothetical protein
MRKFHYSMTPERWLGVILVALAVLTVFFVSVQTSRLNEVTDCQAEYNDAYTDALRDRTAAAARERKAQRKMLVSFLSAERQLTEAEGRKIFDEYLTVLDEADRERTQAPIPRNRC